MISEIVPLLSSNDLYHRGRRERLGEKTVGVMDISYYGILTWRFVSTSGFWLTGTFTVGSTVGF